MSEAKLAARKFLNQCDLSGWKVRVEPNVVSISKYFEPGNDDQLYAISQEADGLLWDVPLTGGSLWGLEGVAWNIALKRGFAEVKKSGNNGKRFMKALSELL